VRPVLNVMTLTEGPPAARKEASGIAMLERAS